MKQPMYPLPEAIEPGRWTIEQGQPRCDVNKRKMWLVLEDDPAWRNVRTHELAHVAFTPKNARKPRSIPESTLQAVEDMRVNRLARANGVKFTGGAPQNIVTGACHFAKDDLRMATLLLVSAFDTDNLKTIAQTLRDTGTKPEIIDQGLELVRGCECMMARYRRAQPSWTYPRTLATAKWLEEQFQKHENIGIPKPGKHGSSSKDSSGLPVGRMWIEKPALVANTAHRNIASTDEGAILRAPWRVTTDQRVFRHTRVPKTGSVLIDASGSMGLSPNDVQRIAATVPAGIVAAYGADCQEGPLRILAHHGRITKDANAYEFPSANVIDIPALEWLATQPKPRVWVSDGRVTGLNDTTYPSITARAESLQRSATINRVDNVSAAVKMLRAGRRV